MMGELDWIDYVQFRDHVRERIEERLALRKVSGMPYTFSVLLIAQASSLRRGFERKGDVRTEYEALVSVETIVDAAADFAAADGRQLIDDDDIKRAMKLTEHQIWPFCG